MVVDEDAGIVFACYKIDLAGTPSFLAKFFLSLGSINIHGKLTLKTLPIRIGTVSSTIPETFTEMALDSPGRVMHTLVTGTPHLRIASFLLTELHSVSPALADQRGGTVVVLTGLGFRVQTNPNTGAQLHDIKCQFGDVGSEPAVDAYNVSFNTIHCTVPPVDKTSSAVEPCGGQPISVSLYGNTGVDATKTSIVNSGFYTANDVAIRRVQSATITEVEPDRGGLEGGMVVTLIGQGFQESSVAMCKFFSTNPLGETLYASMTFVNPNTATCVQPRASAASLQESFVDVTLDGQLYSEAGPRNYEIVGRPANLSSPETAFVVASAITPIAVLVRIVDDQHHRLGRLDLENRTICIVPNITEEACQEGLFQWRSEDDGYPWPPCRNNTLELANNDTAWCLPTHQGEVNFNALLLRNPRATVATLRFEYLTWFTETRLTVLEGVAVALAVSNIRELEGRLAPKGVALSPSPEIIAVDILGNIMTSPGASITIYAHTFYVMDANATDVRYNDRPMVQIHRGEGTKVVFATIVFEYVHGAAHYINFTSENPTLRSALSPGIRTALCDNPERNYKIPDTGRCDACPPAGAICNGTEVIEVMPGFWRGQTGEFIYKCPGGPEVCKGSDQPTGSVCAEGFEGPLCSLCIPGWGKSGATSCSKCPSEGEGLAFILGAGLLAMGLLLGWSTNTLRTAEMKDQSVIIRTAVNHLQAAGKLGEFSTQWSPFLKTIFAVQESTSSMSVGGVASLDCLLRAYNLDYSAIFWGYMMLPIVALFMAFGVFVVVRVLRMVPVISNALDAEIKHDIRAMGTKAKTAILLKRYPLYMVVVTVLCVTMFTLYQTLITQATTVLVCSEFVTANGKVEYFLDVDRTIRCDKDGNHKFRTYALLCAAGYGAGIPLAFMLGYKFVNGRLRAPALTYQMFMFLISGYQDQYWWWQATIMLRKTILVCIIVFVRENAHLQSYCGMWSMSAALCAQIWFQPNSKPEFNLVETVSLAIITVTLNLGLLYFWPEMTDFGKNILTAVLITISLGVFVLFGVFLYQPIKELVMENMEKFMPQLKEFFGGKKDEVKPDEQADRRLELRAAARQGDADDFSDDSELHHMEFEQESQPSASAATASAPAARRRRKSRAGVLRLPTRVGRPVAAHAQHEANFDFDLDDDNDVKALEASSPTALRRQRSMHGDNTATPADRRATATERRNATPKTATPKHAVMEETQEFDFDL
jgi:hypothetical protein